MEEMYFNFFERSKIVWKENILIILKDQILYETKYYRYQHEESDLFYIYYFKHFGIKRSKKILNLFTWLWQGAKESLKAARAEDGGGGRRSA